MKLTCKTLGNRDAGPIYAAVMVRQIARLALLAVFRSKWSAL